MKNLVRLSISVDPMNDGGSKDFRMDKPQSFKDIYGFRQGHKTFIKGTFYDGGTFAGRGVGAIVTERDPSKHAQMRRLLAHAFSNTSLNEQQELILSSVDRFIELVKTKTCVQDEVFDIAKGYERMAFDIIGDLAFGETFGALETDEPNPWITSLLGALTKGAMADTFKRFPAAAKIIGIILRKQLAKLFEDTAKIEEMAIELVKK
ncbi:hypothetical protein Hte_008231 [Hypoxylon texense]